MILPWLTLAIFVLTGIFSFINARHTGKPMPWGYIFVVLTLLRPDKNFVWNYSDLIVLNDMFILAILPVVLLNKHLPFVFYNKEKIAREFIFAFIFGIIYGIFSSLTLSLGEEQSNQLPIITSLLIIAQKSLGEEILYRGFSMGYLKQAGLKSWTLILTQSLFFTLPHLMSYWSNPFGILWTFLFGLMSGYVTLRENSIFMAIIMHVVINITVFLRFQ